MKSVTQRVKEIKQPRGGFLPISLFEAIDLNDGVNLYQEENVHSSIVGMAVDYLIRFLNTDFSWRAFRTSMIGASTAEKNGIIGSKDVAKKLLANIKGLDDDSIVNACKLVSFDVWYGNLLYAQNASKYSDINPNDETIQNIRIIINRSLNFFKQYGPIIKYGFNFFPANSNDNNSYGDILINGHGSCGGYSGFVTLGEGDYLTSDTMWEFKTNKKKPSSQHTLQLLMYWIMGQHSEQDIFKNISKIGFFNPRLNVIYLLEVSKIPYDIIKVIEDEVICYE